MPNRHISDDLKDAMLRPENRGRDTTAEVLKIAQFSRSTLYRARKQKHETGSVARAQAHGRGSSFPVPPRQLKLWLLSHRCSPRSPNYRWISLRRMCGMQRSADLREDTRSSERNDEEAYDNLPAKVLSDSEEHPLPPMPKEDPPLPAIPSGTYSDFLRRICLDLVEFPPNIALLQIRPPKGASRPSRERETAAIAALSRQYLRLREVTLRPSVWRISSPDSYELLGGSK
ncbi:hypothetical protein B0H13DRAFT_1909506 [Mycena leptocephala]|nr:hypothetical protein B0H13DRAFT_1909506 [Mycena leptocephala]